MLHLIATQKNPKIVRPGALSSRSCRVLVNELLRDRQPSRCRLLPRHQRVEHALLSSSEIPGPLSITRKSNASLQGRRNIVTCCATRCAAATHAPDYHPCPQRLRRVTNHVEQRLDQLPGSPRNSGTEAHNPGRSAARSVLGHDDGADPLAYLVDVHIRDDRGVRCESNTRSTRPASRSPRMMTRVFASSAPQLRSSNCAAPRCPRGF